MLWSRAVVGFGAGIVANSGVFPGLWGWLRRSRGRLGRLDHSRVGRRARSFRDLFRQSQIVDDFLLAGVHRTQDEARRLVRGGRKTFWRSRVRTADSHYAPPL